MSSPEHRQHESEYQISARASIFDHDYPIPVAMALTAIIYTATLALPFRFVWTVNNLIPLIQLHGSQISPFSVALSILLIPALFFFVVEFTIMRSYPPVSPTTKVLFLAGITVSSILVGLISPFLPI